jgi:hydroxymethylglutaryl-CoA lyase
MTERVYFGEVVTRDGFQMEPEFVPTEQKINLINQLSTLGFHRIEVSAFSNPARIPMLADASQVFEKIKREKSVIYVALIPNLKGAQRAMGVGVDEFNIVMSVSESHNRENMRMSREESFAQLSEVVGLAKEQKIAVNVSLSTSFGCPFEGVIADAEVYYWVERFVALGVESVSVCDTTGMGAPKEVERVSRYLIGQGYPVRLVMHFHDTRGLGLANVMAAANEGIRHFDSSLGGLGGCPYAPGASGNICTEDAAYMLQRCGFDTGLDFDGLLEAAGELERIVNHALPSRMLQVGSHACDRAAIHPNH